jgi:hypothetical protein
MELLCARPELSHADLLSCNCCQILIEAITMADIVSGSGKCTDDAATLQPVTGRPSQWIWPRERPCPRDITAWRKGLRLISSPTFHLSQTNRLGDWVHKPHKQWDWYQLLSDLTPYGFFVLN